jgi:lysophospholipase L1-like esterase
MKLSVSVFGLRQTLLVFFVAGFATVACAQEPGVTNRFEADIRNFESEDMVDPPPPGAIVLTGSSSIARWNGQAQEALAPLTVIPRGFGGSMMSDLLFNLDRVALTYRPRALLIYEGDNDTGLAVPIDTILSQLREIVDRVHAELPATRIYVLAVKPSILRENIWPVAMQLNDAYRQLADSDPLVYYVDVATPFLNDDGSMRPNLYIGDNLHLNDRGNLIWGATIRAALMPREIAYETDE